jgi:hypothetical protein
MTTKALRSLLSIEDHVAAVVWVEVKCLTAGLQFEKKLHTCSVISSSLDCIVVLFLVPCVLITCNSRRTLEQYIQP